MRIRVDPPALGPSAAQIAGDADYLARLAMELDRTVSDLLVEIGNTQIAEALTTWRDQGISVINSLTSHAQSLSSRLNDAKGLYEFNELEAAKRFRENLTNGFETPGSLIGMPSPVIANRDS